MSTTSTGMRALGQEDAPSWPTRRAGHGAGSGISPSRETMKRTSRFGPWRWSGSGEACLSTRLHPRSGRPQAFPFPVRGRRIWRMDEAHLPVLVRPPGRKENLAVYRWGWATIHPAISRDPRRADACCSVTETHWLASSHYKGGTRAHPHAVGHMARGGGNEHKDSWAIGGGLDA